MMDDGAFAETAYVIWNFRVSREFLLADQVAVVICVLRRRV